MKTPLAPLALALCAVASPRAQSAPTPPTAAAAVSSPTAATAPAQEGVRILSPFEVNSDDDQGYAYPSAIVGTRTSENVQGKFKGIFGP